MTASELQQQRELAHNAYKAGSLAEAERIYRHILAQHPHDPDALHALGLIARDVGKLDVAVTLFQRASRLRPDWEAPLNNLGLAFAATGKITDAIQSYRDAIRINPAYAPAYVNLAEALGKNKDFASAVTMAKRGVELLPNRVEAHIALGNAFRENTQPDEAIAAYQTAIKLQPNVAASYFALADVVKETGDITRALELCRRGVALDPSSATLRSAMLFMMQYDPALSGEEIFNEHRLWNQIHAQPLARPPTPITHPSPTRRLRIGYVSPDFRHHAVGRLLLPLLRHHDHEHFEIFCYSDSAGDALTERFRPLADHWHETRSLSDSSLDELIRSDRIDILIDLAGHTPGNRLLVFARTPAPVQMTWLGYPNTTGLDSIRFRISDPYADPLGVREHLHSEKLIRLPQNLWVYDGNDEQAEYGRRVRSGPITFGCINNPAKINDRVLTLWARLLIQVPDARLILLSSPSTPRAMRLMESLGVAPDRIRWESKRPRKEYLELYNQIDIALDPFPYNGGMTTCDSLWMGTPVIALAGPSHVWHVGVSMLTNCGLESLVARSEDQYIQIAAALARDTGRLSQLHTTLRDQMRHSPLMNHERFARDFESLLRSVWQEACGVGNVAGAP